MNKIHSLLNGIFVSSAKIHYIQIDCIKKYIFMSFSENNNNTRNKFKKKE